MFDFVSIVFDNDIEISQIFLQIHSFKFVDINIINNIYILFNDKEEKNIKFKETFNKNIVKFCPVNLIDKLKIIFISDLINLKEKDYMSDWFTQQFVKLYVSKIISSEYYIVLDSKNNFIKNVNKETFISQNKLIMYYEHHCPELITYYDNCFSYFNLSDNKDDYNPYILSSYVQTTTPYIFITKECQNMISYVENKEGKDFYDFFIYSKKYTEFFFYFAWLCFVNKNNDQYIYLNETIDNVIIGPHDISIYWWNRWDYKESILNSRNPTTFSMSSKSIKYLDESYKENIKNFYKKIYDNDIVNEKIIEMLF